MNGERQWWVSRILYIFRLWAMTESTWKILKLDWKSPGFFSSKRFGINHVKSRVVMSWRWSENHSDTGVNSYTTGTLMKDTFRPDDVDRRGIPCCLPELRYNPDRLQECLKCHRITGRDHQPCPCVLYHAPDKPIVEAPYSGPRPAVKLCSSYTVMLCS